MKRKLLLLFALLLIVSAFTGCGNSGNEGGTEASGDVFKVGAIYPLSGGNALLGNQCIEAVKIAIGYVNDEGGVHGMPVALSTADAPDPTAATTEAGRLIDREGVQVILGSLASGNAIAIAGVTERSGVTLVESGGILDDLTDQGHQNVFRILDKSSWRAAVGVEYVGNG
jgi:branched-chain amino acid transport system substrate-binding protein